MDDPHGHLASIIDAEALKHYDDNSVPPHRLVLKEGDVCLVLRNLSKRFGLATNSRVLILKITQYCLRVQTLGSTRHTVTIPRINFKFRVSGGHSFEITRRQFPLRLSYSLTYNRCQGMTLERVLLDTTSAPFAHGHLYVGLSRVTNHANIRIYCKEEDIQEGVPVVVNVVFPELLLPSLTIAT